MAVQVFHEALCRRYYAARLSSAYIFCVCAAACLFMLPFFLAYSSVPSFWLKTNTYREQPKVTYEYKFLGVLYGTGAGGEPLQLITSSMASVNHLFEKKLRVPTTRSLEFDHNRDGMTDHFMLEALTPLLPGETIVSSSFVAFFNVKLRNRARLEMESIAYSTFASPLAGSALLVDADYVLRQRWPLRAKGGYQLPYDKHPLLDSKSLDLTARQALLARLIAAYRARNNTMDLKNTYMVWTPVVGIADNARSVFNLTLSLRIPAANVLYTPTASEVFKDAWIKYLSIFVVVAYILHQVCSFVFHNQLVDTEVTVETVQNHGETKIKFI